MDKGNCRYPKPIPEPTAQTMRQMWYHIKPPDGCWEWTGVLKPTGYPAEIPTSQSPDLGAFRPQRLMFSWFKYQIPDGFTVDHLCRNRKCVNPDHMEAVTHEENASRGNKRKYCKRGHPLADPNLYYYNSNGRRLRRCLKCIRRERGVAKERRKANS